MIRLNFEDCHWEWSFFPVVTRVEVLHYQSGLRLIQVRSVQKRCLFVAIHYSEKVVKPVTNHAFALS